MPPFSMNPYDEVFYRGRPYPQTHPDRLAAIARLAGMAPAPVSGSRILEIACGAASNIIPMAYGLPESAFVGFDLAARPIEHGKELARRLELGNLELNALDLADFPPDAGQFDYIIAHGLYSWIPAETRNRLLALVTRHLAPHGVAYVSYNAYPGCYLRRMMWEMLRFHTDHLADPRAKVDQARALAKLLVTGRRAQDELGALLDGELRTLMERDPAHLVHDDLAATNDPVYFHEFIDHAQAHGLQFVGEAELGATGGSGLTVEARRVLNGLDPLMREQYLDFILFRRFRQTLLCHADVPLDRSFGPDRMATLCFGARGRVAALQREPGEDGASGAADGDTRDVDALFKALLDALDEAAPRRLALDELPALAGAREGGERLEERGPEFFRQVVLGAVRAGAVVPFARPCALAATPGERPLASLLARVQLETGDIVTNLCHDSLKVDSELPRRLLPLLDGTRTRGDLVTALGAALEGGNAAARAATLDAHLRHLAKLALLIA